MTRCRRCDTLIRAGSLCPACSTRAQRRATAARGGSGWEWQKIRDRVFERDLWTCQLASEDCDAELECAHIVPLSRGGSNDEDNLRTLCGYHHRMTETADRRKR